MILINRKRTAARRYGGGLIPTKDDDVEPVRREKPVSRQDLQRPIENKPVMDKVIKKMEKLKLEQPKTILRKRKPITLEI